MTTHHPDCANPGIRRLAHEEMDVLLAFYLHELTDIDYFWRFFRTMTPSSLALYVDQLPFKDGGAVFVLCCEGAVMAAAEVDVRPGGCADIGIAVSQHQRHKGLGRRLLAHVLAQLPTFGANSARLSYLARNRPLAGLAVGFDFKESKREGDVVLVERSLPMP